MKMTKQLEHLIISLWWDGLSPSEIDEQLRLDEGKARLVITEYWREDSTEKGRRKEESW